MKDKMENSDNKQIDTKFSVSICVYQKDDPEHFKEALESVLNQTAKPDEIVLVVDGPVPELLDMVIRNYEGKSFFKIIRLPENVGHGNARRIGLEKCSNELIALMDADDISVPDRFEKQLECFEQNKDLSIVGGNIAEFIDIVDNIVGIREVPQDDSAIKEYMKSRCPFNQMTVMFKLQDVMNAGGYKDWYHNEDYYLWIRMYQSGAVFKNLKDCLVYVRVGEEMYQRRGGWKYFQSEARLQVFMYRSGVISISRMCKNIILRFIIQIVLPNRLRGIVYRRLFRTRHSNC